VHWWPWYPQWADIDIRAELARHWHRHGGLPDDVEHRLRAYQLHIGLDAMAYTAFTSRWEDLQRNADQLAVLVEGG
jgi:hygromycin-B 4-O-kinase